MNHLAYPGKGAAVNNAEQCGQKRVLQGSGMFDSESWNAARTFLKP